MTGVSPWRQFAAGFTLTVIVCGVLQAPLPKQSGPIEVVSQFPPEEVEGLVKNVTPAPVVAMVSVCGSGLGPANTFEKAIAFTCLNTFAPTTTLTGTVTLVPDAVNTI